MPVAYGTIYQANLNAELPAIEAALGYPEETIGEIYFNVEVWTSGKNLPACGYEPPEYEELDDVNLNSVTLELADSVVTIDDKDTLKLLREYLPEEDELYWNIVEENV
jgi:hypothetical protein